MDFILIIRSEHNETTPRYSKAEEHLRCRIFPYQGVQQPLPLGDEEELDAVHGPLQRDAAHQKGDQDGVGEGGGELKNIKMYHFLLTEG